MKEVFPIILLSLFITAIILMIVLQYNPFRKVSLWKRRKVVILKKVNQNNISLQFENSPSNSSQQIHNKLPNFIKEKYSIIYDHCYKKFEDIFIFKSSNEKWGALKYNKENNHYSIIAENIYDSTGFYPSYNVIVAVIYKNEKFSDENVQLIFNNNGELIKKLNHISYIDFGNFGNISFSKDNLYGLLNQHFDVIIPAKYKYFHALENNLFIVKTSEESEQLIINEKDEIIYNLKFSEVIYKYTYNHKIIIKVVKDYYLLNIETGNKTKLNYDLIYPISRLYNLLLWPTNLFITVTDYTDGDEDFFKEYGAWGDRFMTSKGKYGLMNGNGEVCIPNIYDRIVQIHDDYFKVAMGEFNFKIEEEKDIVIATGGKWGIINSRHEIIIPIKYTDIYFDRHKNSFLAYEGGVMIAYEDPHESSYIWHLHESKEIEFRIQ